MDTNFILQKCAALRLRHGYTGIQMVLFSKQQDPVILNIINSMRSINN